MDIAKKCNMCGYESSSPAEHWDHCDRFGGFSHDASYSDIYSTIPEQGHYENQVVQEGYNEEVSRTYCTGCGATK